ncbi:hypothetical protein FNV43_RR23949 [Rhamnella rubrinervis]|uniref:Protein kinase domain-containing protein n=1 Tax=Rhamnella rubrinervis TaxID=2594499 RepID=A0A8K0DX66_9ROSA|nr:hypothetical protein FNV43_RR23949 [Rhamnella rubrinervis]
MDADSAAVSQNECAESRCSRHGPVIRFPFRLKESHPKHSGYAGFELSCTQNNHTVLELPVSVKLFVKKINYKSQTIHLSDPEKCFARHFRNLNLSAPPFGYFVFDCMSEPKGYEFIALPPCLTASGQTLYAVAPVFLIKYMSLSLISCTKLYEISFMSQRVLRQKSDDLVLRWLTPNCFICEAQGSKCRLKSNNSTKPAVTECYNRGPKPSKGATTKLVATGSILGFFLLLLVVIVLYYFLRTKRIDEENQAEIEMFLADYEAHKPTRFSYVDIKRITNQFKVELGQGTYGTVYKGKLSNEILVAVKVLSHSKGKGEEFINDVGIIGLIHHVNVVRLVGFGADGFRRALVYEFLPNASLQKFISSIDSRTNFLGWIKLQRIALGIAKGTEYLHQGCDQRIVHFDIKPHNVLLDDNFNPKISDFGLAKLCAKDQSVVSMTTARGTVGYIAPEVFSRNFGDVSYKSDVYSFGMLLLEMVGSNKKVDFRLESNAQFYEPEWIYSHLEKGVDLEIHMEDEKDAEIAKKLEIVGLWCIQWQPVDRPSMSVVVNMLEGEEELAMPPNPFPAKGLSRKHASLPGNYNHQELPVISE